MKVLSVLCALGAVACATPLYFDGRVPFSYSSADLDASRGPYLTGVKGTQNASHYTTLLGHAVPPTPLWNALLGLLPTEQTLRIRIDNSSVFTPGTNAPQLGFRRTEILAQGPDGHAALEAAMELATSVFHFSVKEDVGARLDGRHEYQAVFVEPSDGSHVFGLQLGSPFSNPTGKVPAPGARNVRVLDHALNVLFEAPFVGSAQWHNFAVQVDWERRTLGVFYSLGGAPLRAVTRGVVPNLSAAVLPAGRGEFHVGLLKLPLVNPKDSAADQGDVVHHGIQEGTTEGLLYSGVFVEDVRGGVSVGYGLKAKALGA